MSIQQITHVTLAAVVMSGNVATAAAMRQGLLPDTLPGVAAFGKPHVFPGTIPLIALIVFVLLLLVLVFRLAGKRHSAFALSVPLPESGLRRAQRSLARLLEQAPLSSDGTHRSVPAAGSLRALSPALPPAQRQ